MKTTTWLIVANSSLARLFHMETIKHLKELKVFEHPESRLRNLDLVSDKPGRDFESLGMGRHSYETKTLPKQHEFALFAKELAEYLQEAHQKGEFQILYLAANPSLLGLLRQSLQPAITSLIQKELDKDLTQLKPDDILSHFTSS